MYRRFLPALLAAGLLTALCACTPKKSIDMPGPTPAVTPAPTVTPVVEDPSELLKLLQNAINDDMDALEEGPLIKCTGSELADMQMLCEVYINEGYAELWQLDYRLFSADSERVQTLDRARDDTGAILGNRMAVVRTDAAGEYAYYYGSIPTDDIADPGNQKLLEKAVLELCWNIPDLEFSLTRDGFPQYSGLGGNGVLFMASYEYENYTEEKLPWTDLIYVEGDYWQQAAWSGLTAVSLVSPSRNRQYLQSIDTTLPDVETYRGIRLGATREEVLAAYPEIVPEDWPTGEWGDQLVYESIPGYIAGSFLHFYFGADGKVNRVILENIQD